MDGSNLLLLGHLKLYHIPFMLENLMKMEVIKNREIKLNFLHKFNFSLIIFRKFNLGILRFELLSHFSDFYMKCK